MIPRASPPSPPAPPCMGCTHWHHSQQWCSGPSHPSHRSPSEPELRNSLHEPGTASPGTRRSLLAGQIRALAKQVNDLTPFRGDLPLNFEVRTPYGRREFDPKSTQLQTRDRNTGLYPWTGGTWVGDVQSTQLPWRKQPDPARVPAQSKDQDPSAVLGAGWSGGMQHQGSPLLLPGCCSISPCWSLAATWCHLATSAGDLRCESGDATGVKDARGVKDRDPTGACVLVTCASQGATLVLQRMTFTWFSKQASSLFPAYGVKARTPNISQPPTQHRALFPLRQVALPGIGSGGGPHGVPEQLRNTDTKHHETGRVIDNRIFHITPNQFSFAIG